MAKKYEHLGEYSNWVSVAKSANNIWGNYKPSKGLKGKIDQLLRFSYNNDKPMDVKLERTWEDNGLTGEEISWSVGYGPRTFSWILKPSNIKGKLPGILALHDHGAFKIYGKEKITDGPEGVNSYLINFRNQYYSGRAFANDLARRGFVVLINDVFLWGTRRFPIEAVPESYRNIGLTYNEWWENDDSLPDEFNLYNATAAIHEHIIEKYCAALGTTLSAVINYEDRVAINYLLNLPYVDSDRIGCLGLSGGGCRAGLLHALCKNISVTVITGMMSSYEYLLDHNIVSHSWIFFPSGLSKFLDWPDLIASSAPTPLMVQYLIDDAQFTKESMDAADIRIKKVYAKTENINNYCGKFYPGYHRFDQNMQNDAFEWIRRYLLK